MSPVPKEDRDKPTDDNPECNNVENDESVPDFIIMLTSSESETESDTDIDYDGYVLLPQEGETFENLPATEILEDTGSFTFVPNNPWQLDEEEPQSSTTAPVFPYTVPDPPVAEASSLLWNQTNPAAQAEMDTDSSGSAVGAVLQQALKGQEERVRAAMKGFQLPSPNIPDWAKNVPEDKWKEHLLDKLRQLTTRDSEEDKNHEKDPSQNDDSSLK